MSSERGWPAYQHEVRAILGRRQSQFRRVVKLQPPDKSGWAAIPMIEPWHFEFRKDATLYGPRGARPGSGWIYTALRKWDPEWPPETVNSRLLSFQPSKTGTGVGGLLWRCPYGVPGDRLWVRESFVAGYALNEFTHLPDWRNEEAYRAWYKATDDLPYWMDCDGKRNPVPWKSSIHMPRWASRILLEVMDIRVERVQEITEEGAQAEDVMNWWRETVCPLPENRAAQDHECGTPVACFGCLWDSINAKRGYSWEMNPWVWVVRFKRI